MKVRKRKKRYRGKVEKTDAKRRYERILDKIFKE
jgi:hypothetical protein